MRSRRSPRRSTTSSVSTEKAEMTNLPPSEAAIIRAPRSTPSSWEIPNYKIDELSDCKHDYCLVIPVINEGDRLLGQLERLAASSPPLDIIIADGGSDDGSTQCGRLQALGVRTLLTKTGLGKLSAQLRMGFAYAI